MILAIDLDGTIITAEEKQSYLLKAVACRYGINLNCNDIWEKKRAGINNFMLLQQIGISKSVASAICFAWLREIESSYWLSLDTLFKNALDVLGELRAYSFRLVLITARQNEYLMRQQVYRLGIEEYFESIYCVDPKSVVIEKSRWLRCSDAIGFIGDSETDVQASQCADVPFYGVCTGQRSEKFLLNNGLVQVSHSLGSAVEILLKDLG